MLYITYCIRKKLFTIYYLTDTAARSHAEGQVGIGRDLGSVGRQEPFRLKLIRLRPQVRVAMDAPHGNDQGLTLSYGDVCAA